MQHNVIAGWLQFGFYIVTYKLLLGWKIFRRFDS